MTNLCEGPLANTERLTLPGTRTYYEISQRRSANGIYWNLEHGHIRWGHRGTWGRNNAQAATELLAHCLDYEVRRLTDATAQMA